MKPIARRRRRGMILLNVLVIVAIAAAAVAVMISAQDIEIQRTIRLTDASQAQAYARAGELSALVSLRRDGEAGSDRDAYNERWAAVGQRDVAIPSGRFALTISDEQARFNINSLANRDATSAARFALIAQAAGVSARGAEQIAGLLAVVGAAPDEGLLITAGVDPADIQRLAPYVAFLPADARLNLNTAEPGLILILANNSDGARALLAARAAAGSLNDADVAASGLGDLGGLTSDHFTVSTDVQVGDVALRTKSQLVRRIDEGVVSVVVASRRRIGLQPTA